MKNMDLTSEPSAVCSAEIESTTTEATPTKKVFIEPKVSVPVDVLEVTTFQQVVDSGATN